MKNKSRQTERGKVECEWCSSALFEENKEPDKQINQPDEIDVEISRRPLVNCVEMIEIGVIVATLFGIRGPLDQVVDVAADSRLVQIDLNVFRMRQLLRSAYCPG